MKKQQLKRTLLLLLLVPFLATGGAAMGEERTTAGGGNARAVPIESPTQWCVYFPQLPVCAPPTPAGGPLTEVTNFGSNPGNLQMFEYVPKDLGTSRPLVVVLHGCTETAADYAGPAGWIAMADKYRFALLAPQQQRANNPYNCFRWFEPSQNQRDQGEAASIKQAIDQLRSNLNSDSSHIYVTGLSGGGGMAVALLADYPDLFAGGGIIAGIPYGCANSSQEATSQCGVTLQQGTSTPMKNLTPAQWAQLGKQGDPGFNGTYPRISIWQGTADQVVNPQDENELIKQWTGLLNLQPPPQIDETVKGNIRHQVFENGSGRAMVEAYFIPNGPHATPIDPGTADDQCGTNQHDQWIQPEGICSSFYIVKFWGIDQPTPTSSSARANGSQNH